MEVYEAKYDYLDGSEDGLIKFKKGEKFFIIQKSDGGWWAAQNLSTNEIGYVPGAFVECIGVFNPLTFNENEAFGSQQNFQMDRLCKLTASVIENSHAGKMCGSSKGGLRWSAVFQVH